MEYLDEFLILQGAMLLALLSPGPDFAMIVKQSIFYGKKASIISSIGIGLGICVHIIYTILGIGLIISKSVLAYSIIKYLGALYLIYLGYKSLKSNGINLDSNTSNNQVKHISNKKAFIEGFLCNVLNPKATLFFISIFTVVVDVKTPLVVQGFYGISCMLTTIVWFVCLSLILSHKKVRSFFNSFGKWFDKTIGVVLIALGLKVAFSK